jgi:hypothetical protein
MKNLDGKNLNNSKQWRCDRNKDHILGVIERVQVSVLLDDQSTLKYYTTRLLIFRAAVDLGAEVPAEIEVSGTLDGKMLSMIWKCSVPGCGCIKEWHPDEGALEWLRKRYASQKEGVK